MEFSESLALALLESDQEFPVDFDDAWQWIGYSRKDHGKSALGWDSKTKTWKGPFVEGLDFSRSSGKSSGGRCPELIMLTVDCFKSLGMMAGTEKGKEVRRYFLECERKLKQLLISQKTVPQSLPSSRDRLEDLKFGMELMNELGGIDPKTEIHFKDRIRDILLEEMTYSFLIKPLRKS